MEKLNFHAGMSSFEPKISTQKYGGKDHRAAVFQRQNNHFFTALCAEARYAESFVMVRGILKCS